MIQIRKLDSIEMLQELKREYIQQATAPLDGMWLFGFVPMAQHYGFYLDSKLVGYCCVDANGYLLQFLVLEPHWAKTSSLFARILAGVDEMGRIAGAFVSTAEPTYLSTCVDHFQTHEVNAFMYQLGSVANRPPTNTSLSLVTLGHAQLDTVVAFAHDNLGAPTEWLETYFAQLLRRRELYGLWKGGKLIASGESRAREMLQTQYTDLGVIVARSEQRQGLGTLVLQQLVQLNEEAGQRCICSAEWDNRGAQIAIERAGFIAKNRILRFDAK